MSQYPHVPKPRPLFSRKSTGSGMGFRSTSTGSVLQSQPSGLYGSQRLRLDVAPRLERLVSVQRGGDYHGNYDDEDAEVATTASPPTVTTRLSTTKSLSPLDLLRLESGDVVVVSPDQQRQDANGDFIIVASKRETPMAMEDTAFFEARSKSLRASLGGGLTRDDIEFGGEIGGCLGVTWRYFLRLCMMASYDRVNGLRLTRAMQLNLFFMTAHEAHILGLLIEAYDTGRPESIRGALRLAFSNRNVSRLIVQTIRARYDWIWHTSTAIAHNRLFDAIGQFPIVGITAFAATENFPSTRDHAVASITRRVLGEGRWITRFLTGGREGLTTDGLENPAQNLAAESNNFELANRNQFGTYIGRMKTNEFRFDHRLPIDESLVRTFVSQPASTMVNNGVVHVLRQLAKHWRNMLTQKWGNFAHQRMEQLDPFETLRFHMPVVLSTLASLRGRNHWDSEILAPVILQLQNLRPENNTQVARGLIADLKNRIVLSVCGGVMNVMTPFHEWLDAMAEACLRLEEEAAAVFQMVSTVELGIRLGFDCASRTDFNVPSDRVLKNAIRDHLLMGQNQQENEWTRAIVSALNLTTPRDKRTLIELFQKGFEKTEPAQLLLARVMTLLQRELRRKNMNQTIVEASKGQSIAPERLVRDDWYWLQMPSKEPSVYIFLGRRENSSKHVFLHVTSGVKMITRLTPEQQVQIFTYVPVAEAISRAQRVFMNIELEYGRRFKYSAFMELSYLRTPLQRLIVVSAMNCEALDDARLNVLKEYQRSNRTALEIGELEIGKTYFTFDGVSRKYEPFEFTASHKEGGKYHAQLRKQTIVQVVPQSVLVVGGGPTGLMATIHCAECALATGGEVKLYESRDAFLKGGATFERAQIVRLDGRWIAMMRYHLGTIFEDIFIPASGETDAQLGNTLPTQGFVEITIKDLEYMLHAEVSRLWSKGIITVYTESKASYDSQINALVKLGPHLKKGDLVRRKVDPNLHRSDRMFTWRVREVEYTPTLGASDLVLGDTYSIFLRSEETVVPFRLIAKNLDTNMLTFRSLQDGVDDLLTHSSSLPSIYRRGANEDIHSDIRSITMECVQVGTKGAYRQDIIPMNRIVETKFEIDVGHTHVFEAIGKNGINKKSHISFTTEEPHAVCCIQGLKVSLGMHNFGEKRFGSGFVDDIRSINDQNTRIVGDFTKMVRSSLIAMRMRDNMVNDENWQTHFKTLAVNSSISILGHGRNMIDTLTEWCERLAREAKDFKRKTLQTRFFETGDNYYLGMELNREYETWKRDLANAILSPLPGQESPASSSFKRTLLHHVDRLWFDATLETIRTGDVYNPGANLQVPHLYLIDSYYEERLGNLPIGESFRDESNQKTLYEVVHKPIQGDIVVRNIEGFIERMPRSKRIKRNGNLSRSPDGVTESKVALSSFPVTHYVNFRTMRVLDEERGFAIAFAGDEQSSPHFMRYSGLTGACINAMSFNIFLRKAVEGVSFKDRFREYSEETNFSNGEVVQRGTGSNFGIDGFLRPGFSYDRIVSYLHSKAYECRESGQDISIVRSHDWLVKLASALVPRGLETNFDFVQELRKQFRQRVSDQFIRDVQNDPTFSEMTPVLQDMRMACSMEAARDTYWENIRNSYSGSGLSETHVDIASTVDSFCEIVIQFAVAQYRDDKRAGSEVFHQPKPVDSVVDDFAVEAQNFANALTMSAAFAAGALALSLLHEEAAGIFSAILGSLNILISFGTMTNVSRYKIRNEESRILFFDDKLMNVKKATYRLMPRAARQRFTERENPYIACLEEKAQKFRDILKYYDHDPPEEFDTGLAIVLGNLDEVTNLRDFQKRVQGELTASRYHENSYIQEALVNVAESFDQLYNVLVAPDEHDEVSQDAEVLFRKLLRFEPILNESLQKEPVRWGFIKKRKFQHWDISSASAYLYSMLWLSSARGNASCAPLQIKTLGISKLARQISNKTGGNVMNREARDLEALYWASRESGIASLIFVTAFLVFVASCLFTIARIFRLEFLLDISFWAMLPSAFGAILASFHLVRKLAILFGLQFKLGSFGRQLGNVSARGDLGTVLGVNMAQILLTVVRLLAAVSAAIALPLALAEMGFMDETPTSPELPSRVASASIVLAIGATLLFFIVEYSVRYHLPVELGPFVCGIFHHEIERMHHRNSYPRSAYRSPQLQERETWEYTAREFLHRYRFDAVFAADRYGMILQFIQSGMDNRGDMNGGVCPPGVEITEQSIDDYLSSAWV